jgi:hypothetical protein
MPKIMDFAGTVPAHSNFAEFTARFSSLILAGIYPGRRSGNR